MAQDPSVVVLVLLMGMSLFSIVPQPPRKASSPGIVPTFSVYLGRGGTSKHCIIIDLFIGEIMGRSENAPSCRFVFHRARWHISRLRIIGADRRRHHGLLFGIHFVDTPTGQNELKKNHDVKLNLINFCAEFWFVARFFWLSARPFETSDHALPLTW